MNNHSKQVHISVTYPTAMALLGDRPYKVPRIIILSTEIHNIASVQPLFAAVFYLAHDFLHT